MQEASTKTNNLQKWLDENPPINNGQLNYRHPLNNTPSVNKGEQNQYNQYKWRQFTHLEWKNTTFKNALIKEYVAKIEELKLLQENIKYFNLLKNKKIKYNRTEWSGKLFERRKLENKIVHIITKNVPNLKPVLQQEIIRLTQLKNSI